MAKKFAMNVLKRVAAFIVGNAKQLEIKSDDPFNRTWILDILESKAFMKQ